MIRRFRKLPPPLLMNRLLKTVLAAGLLASGLAVAQVPSLINYQGRLTDANGAAVTGSKTFAISIYDDATAGNLLYTEDIGSVTLDANGVYSFQFGAAGTNYSLVTETLATTDGTATTYQKALSKSNIVAGTTSVTDGTYSWTETAGNPGSTSTATATAMFGFVVSATVTSGGSAYADAPAVTITGSGTGATATATVSNGAVTDITITNAGSGYTTGATITIAPPPLPFGVTYSAGSITATYASAPAAGTAIKATYRYGTSGITGALNGNTEFWLKISIDGTSQATRQRLLVVPLALRALSTEENLRKEMSTNTQLSELTTAIVQNLGVSFSSIIATSKSTNSSLGTITAIGSAFQYGGGELIGVDYTSVGEIILGASLQFAQAPYNHNGYIRFVYTDGTDAINSWGGYASNGNVLFVNPNPNKRVRYIKATQIAQGWNDGPFAAIKSFYAFSGDIATIKFSSAFDAKKVYICPQASSNEIKDTFVSIIFSDATEIKGSWNQWIDFGSTKSIVSISAGGIIKTSSNISIPQIKVLSLK